MIWASACLLLALAAGADPWVCEDRPEQGSDPDPQAVDEDAKCDEKQSSAAPLPDGSTVGAIEIRVGDIFDTSQPGENHLVFRLANRLHRKTRDAVIKHQLLFEEGDRYDPLVIEESARSLRKNRYIRDAEIVPVRFHEDVVDLAVVTHDVWTLNASLGLGRSGGVNSTRFKVEDVNLFGTGKGLSLVHASDVDRTSTGLAYADQNLLGSRWRLDAAFSDNSDGSRYGVEVGRPFFSLDSRWAAGLKAHSETRLDSLYDLGTITGQFGHQRDLLEVSGGRSRGRAGDRVHRWSTGFTFLRDRFELASAVAVPGDPPEDRTLAYPWVAFDSLEDSYLRARNQDRFERVEDQELGHRTHMRLGFSSQALGATEEAMIFDALVGAGLRLSARQTVLFASDLAGRWGRDGAENLNLGVGARYYWRDFGDHLFFATLQGNLASHLDPENQILLGGDTGLRGYPLRYQAGERSLLLTLEQRYFTGLNLWKAFRVGGAVFFDAGGVWGGESPGEAAELGLLEDIGVGLRLGSTRSGRGSVIHLDVAFPLGGDGSIRSLQWLIKSKETF